MFEGHIHECWEYIIGMSYFSIGDRVRSEYLGDGTITDMTEVDFLIIVLFDNTPSIKYNMGENPTAELVSALERIELK